MKHFREAFSHIRGFSSAFWIVIAATLMNQTGNMAVVFLVLYASQYLGFSVAASSLCFAAVSGSMLITGMIGGGLSDRFGPAWIMVLALFANGLILFAFPFFHSYPLIFIMCLIWGSVFGFYRPASQTFISNLSTAGMHKVTFSVYRLVINLGMSIGPALGGYLAMHSYTAIFFANGIANLLASAILFFGLYRTNWLSYKNTHARKIDLGIRWLKHDSALRLFVFAMIPVSMIFFQHESTLPVVLDRDMHLPLTFYGLLFTLNTLIIVFLELPLNVATLSWSYRTNFLLGSALVIIGFAGLYFATSTWHIMLLTVFWTVGEMIFYPAASSYIADIAPEDKRGSYMSMYTTCSNLGMLLGPWAGAVVLERINAHGLWLACGLWGILSLVQFYYLREPKTLPVQQVGEIASEVSS